MTDKKEKSTKEVPNYLIRTIRNAMGISIYKLAEMAGVEYYSIYRAEAGLPIRADSIYKISKALSISPDIIFYNIGQFPEDKIELVKKDPLAFSEAINELCEQPWKLTKTHDYMEKLATTMKDEPNINPEIKKILNQISPK